MKLVVIVSLILLANCGVAGASNDRENATQDVKYCDLTKNPPAFSGKRIRVRAIYSYMFEVSRLKPPACCPERDVAIWIDFSDEMDGQSKKLFHSFPKGMGFVLVTFEGVFESGGPYGDGGYRFKFTVDRIEKLENKANPSPSHRPAWIPNCEKSDAAQTKQSSSLLHEMLHVDGDAPSPKKRGPGATYTYDAAAGGKAFEFPGGRPFALFLPRRVGFLTPR